MVAKIDKQGFEDALKAVGKPVVVDFTADWCPYCKRLAPIVEEIAEEHKDEIDVYFLDIDDNPDIAEQFDVMTIPTVYVFKDGDALAHAVNPGNKEAVLELIFQ